MNDFLSITSNGGYLGRFYWRNSGVHPELPHWGEFDFLSHVTIMQSAWAGSIWVVRAVTKGF